MPKEKIISSYETEQFPKKFRENLDDTLAQIPDETLAKVNQIINPEKSLSREEIIQDVIDNKFELFDIDTMANYDADFSGQEPFFINIWSKQKGFGYVVFHDFLRRVGLQKTFLSTDFTGDGEKLFNRAISDGLIKKISEHFGLHRLTRWQVVNDPIGNLKKIKAMN